MFAAWPETESSSVCFLLQLQLDTEVTHGCQKHEQNPGGPPWQSTSLCSPGSPIPILQHLGLLTDPPHFRFFLCNDPLTSLVPSFWFLFSGNQVFPNLNLCSWWGTFGSVIAAQHPVSQVARLILTLCPALMTCPVTRSLTDGWRTVRRLQLIFKRVQTTTPYQSRMLSHSGFPSTGNSVAWELGMTIHLAKSTHSLRARWLRWMELEEANGWAARKLPAGSQKTDDNAKCPWLSKAKKPRTCWATTKRKYIFEIYSEGRRTQRLPRTQDAEVAVSQRTAGSIPAVSSISRTSDEAALWEVHDLPCKRGRLKNQEKNMWNQPWTIKIVA